MPISITGDWSNVGAILGAVGAIGTAATGLVDSTKVYNGGISNAGFSFIDQVLKPYFAALKLVNAADPLATFRANWLNGVPKDEQKAKVKALIHLGLTTATAPSLAAAAPGVDAAKLQSLAVKLDAGEALGEDDVTALGRFDAILDAQLDQGFERADQVYRNAAKALAGAFAIALALLGVWAVEGSNVDPKDFALAAVAGAISIPLAPVVKDLSSALGTAVSAMKALRG